MMKKLVASFSCAVAGLVFIAPGVCAEESFQTVFEGLYRQQDGDQGNELIAYGIEGRRYFEPVKTDGHPYAEAAFLERIGSVYALAVQEEIERPSREGDGQVFGIGVNFAKPGFPVAVEVNYLRGTREYEYPSTLEVTGDVIGIRAGYFVKDARFIGIRYLYSESDNESAGGHKVVIRQHQYGLFAKRIFDLGENGSLVFQPAVTRLETEKSRITLRNSEVSILIDYYFTRSLSAGLGFRHNYGTDQGDEGYVYLAGLQYYIAPRFSVDIGYSQFENSNAGFENSKSYNISMAARF